jgi:hypothetical protein
VLRIRDFITHSQLNVLDTQNIADREHDFPAIEAEYFFNTSYEDSALIKALIKDNIVIVGFLESPNMNNPDYVTDKHRVPVSFDLFNRSPTMPGAVVHANALQTLIQKEKGEVYKIIEWQFNLIAGVIIFSYLLIFNLLHKIRPILIKLLVEIAILVASIMTFIWWSGNLLGRGYHIDMGKILFYIAVLIEYKMFAFEFYDYLLELRLRKLVGNWYSCLKSKLLKNRLNKKGSSKRK